MAKKLGELLLGLNLVTKAQLQTGLRTQEFFGGHLGSILIELGFLGEEALGEALAHSNGVRYAPPEFLEGIPQEVLDAIPAALADKHEVIPLRVLDRRLHLAMVNPRNLHSVDEISSITGMVVVPYVAPEFRMYEALERYYDIVRQRGRRIDVPGARLTPSSRAPETPATAETNAEEIGMDGLPMDAEIDPDSAPFASSFVRRDHEDLLEQLPSSVEEWEPDSSPPKTTAPTPTAVAAEKIPETGPAATPELAHRFLEAESRDAIAAILLEVTARFFGRRLLFIVQRDRIVGWTGSGDGVDARRVKEVMLSLDSLSVFSAVKEGARPLIGPIADVPANRRLFDDLGLSSPSEVMLLPIRIKDRVVAIFYGDNSSSRVGGVDVELLRRYTLQTALALEILILRNKLLSL